MEITVEIEALLWESLLIQAAEEELPVEEIVERAVRDYGKGDEDVARRREERNHG